MDRALILDDVDAGLSAFGLGQHFAAHEHFESAWHALASPSQRPRPAPPPEPIAGSALESSRPVEESSDRLAARALVQISAAEVKRSARNLEGVEKLLTKAQANLTRVDGSAFGLDMAALAGAVAIARSTGQGPVVLPPRCERVGVLYLHGFASSPGSAKAVRFAEALRADGIPVRIPALDGGDFFSLTVSRALERARRGLFDRTLVIGSSMGGYLAALLGADPRVAALVLMAPAFDLARRLGDRLAPGELEQWRRDGARVVDHYGTGRPERISSAFLDDAAQHPAHPPIARPAYVLHGLRDDTVPSSLAEEACRRAEAPVELDLVDDEHALVASADRAVAAARRLWAEHVGPPGD